MMLRWKRRKISSVGTDAMVIASIPMVALFLVFHRHIVAGIGAGSTKG